MPLTIMTDANLVRVLQAQTRRSVGLIDYRTVAAAPKPSLDASVNSDTKGPVSPSGCFDDGDFENRCAANAMSLVTAVPNRDGIPQNLVSPKRSGGALASPNGAQAIVSGSCSTAPMAKSRLRAWRRGVPVVRLHFRPVSR